MYYFNKQIFTKKNYRLNVKNNIPKFPKTICFYCFYKFLV